MLQGWVLVGAAFGYIGLLFAIAYYADKRALAGQSVIANPVIYSLSLAVYATAWTFYGSVGRAASDGVGFLPIYIGPTLMILLFWFVVRKMIRISRVNRITSLADFVGSRYGKSALIGGLVTVIAVIGILPYISLQLKAVSASFTTVLQYPEIVIPAKVDAVPLLGDTALWVALYRALESERPDAIFHDPYARRLAGDRAERIMETLPKAKTWGWPMVVRTAVMDELILKAVAQGSGTVLNLAAGLDARPYRLPRVYCVCMCALRSCV